MIFIQDRRIPSDSRGVAKLANVFRPNDNVGVLDQTKMDAFEEVLRHVVEIVGDRFEVHAIKADTSPLIEEFSFSEMLKNRLFCPANDWLQGKALHVTAIILEVPQALLVMLVDG